MSLTVEGIRSRLRRARAHERVRSYWNFDDEFKFMIGLGRKKIVRYAANTRAHRVHGFDGTPIGRRWFAEFDRCAEAALDAAEP